MREIHYRTHMNDELLSILSTFMDSLGPQCICSQRLYIIATGLYHTPNSTLWLGSYRKRQMYEADFTIIDPNLILSIAYCHIRVYILYFESIYQNCCTKQKNFLRFLIIVVILANTNYMWSDIKSIQNACLGPWEFP